MGKTSASNVSATALAIGRVGALCGNVHLIEPPAWITDNAIVLHVDEQKFNGTYLSHLLRSRNLNEIASKTAQPLITGTQILDQRLPAPSLQEQLSIQSYLKKAMKQIDALVEEAARSSNLLQERRTALISAAVTGKIDVREHALQETA